MNMICLTRQESLVDIIMNYVAFQGITQIDELYLASEQNMKAKNIVEKKKDEVQNILQYNLKKGEEGWDAWRKTWTEPGDRYIVMRMIFIVYNIFKFMYKTIYFYLLPYMIIPLSFYSYVDN